MTDPSSIAFFVDGPLAGRLEALENPGARHGVRVWPAMNYRYWYRDEPLPPVKTVIYEQVRVSPWPLHYRIYAVRR